MAMALMRPERLRPWWQVTSTRLPALMRRATRGAVAMARCMSPMGICS